MATSTFYHDGCLKRKCDGCEFGPWSTNEVTRNGVEYGTCSLWNVVQRAPWPQTTEPVCEFDENRARVRTKSGNSTNLYVGPANLVPGMMRGAGECKKNVLLYRLKLLVHESKGRRNCGF